MIIHIRKKCAMKAYLLKQNKNYRPLYNDPKKSKLYSSFSTIFFDREKLLINLYSKLAHNLKVEYLYELLMSYIGKS